MTLIVAITRPDTIWFLADRRLSSGGRLVTDDACKTMLLETSDGKAILGYSGLGATGLGNQPADWMARVLHGKNLPLEQSLHVLSEAMKAQLPRHMQSMPTPTHSVFATAFLKNKPRLYTIDLVSPDRQRYFFRYTYWYVDGNERRPMWLNVGGSGLAALEQDQTWIPPLLQILRWHDHRQVPALAVADHLAKLNYEVHLRDKTVGPRCIVAWRHKSVRGRQGGGSHQFYSGTARDDASGLSLPLIANGVDLKAIFAFLTAQLLKPASSRMDDTAVQKALDALPKKSDERLR
jgi:hypothetical protein